MKKIYAVMGLILLTGCTDGTGIDEVDQGYVAESAVPTVDYIESLDVYSSEHKDSFLNMLAMNYRSYAIYNARTSGYSDIGERFAQKAVAAFSGETPFPENVEEWGITNNQLNMTLNDSHMELMEVLRNDASDLYPEITAEAQAKFDCWVSASASCQTSTAEECRIRFENAMAALKNNIAGGGAESKIVKVSTTQTTETGRRTEQAKAARVYYPATTGLRSATTTSRARDGMIIVNNVNIPQNLIQPVPVTPFVFNQNIVSGGKDTREVVVQEQQQPIEVITEQVNTDDLVSREEFIREMLALRAELAAINARLDGLSSERTVLKVQQIPLEPQQHIMEEVFEVQFDFNKANIKPEYEEIIRKLVETTRSNRNVKVSVIGHTDTSGKEAYNFALGGRRAESVRQTLIKYGIPSSQIVSVSSGEKDLKVQTGDGVKNRENRRARVVKEEMVTETMEAPRQMQVVTDERIMGFPVDYQEQYVEETYGMPTPLYDGI